MELEDAGMLGNELEDGCVCEGVLEEKSSSSEDVGGDGVTGCCGCSVVVGCVEVKWVIPWSSA